MAGDLTVGLDMIAAATIPTKPSARLLWGVVTSAAAPVQVVLENDASAMSRPVSGNAAGPCVVGDRVLLARQRRRLTIIANPTAQGRVQTPGTWVTIATLSGFTGTLRARRISANLAELDATVNGAIPVGNTQVSSAVPAELRPAGTVRIPGYGDGGATPVVYVTSAGVVGVSHRNATALTYTMTRAVYPIAP